jgi:hypothetical protein
MIEPVARRSTIVGLVACVAGLLIVLLASAAEVMRDPALSLADGYWIGRLPWISIGVSLVVFGATVAVLAALVASWIGGGWIRRVISAGAVGLAAIWWVLAFLGQGGGAYCPICEPAGPDPVTFAYSLPGLAALLLVAPAILAGIVALLPRRQPVHPSVAPGMHGDTP